MRKLKKLVIFIVAASALLAAGSVARPFDDDLRVLAGADVQPPSDASSGLTPVPENIFACTQAWPIWHRA